MVPKVHLIVLNWNNYNDTKECVESLEKVKYANCQIVIVDNNSQDGSGRMLEKNFPNHKVILNSSNLGYSGGNNVGIAYSLDESAEFIILVNNDIVVQSEFFLQDVIHHMSNHEVDILAPRIVSHETNQEISIYTKKSWWDLVLRLLTLNEGRKEEIKNFNELLLLGSFLVIRTDVIKKIGSLNEDFFMYCEENEFLLRACMNKLRIDYFADVTVSRKLARDGYKYKKRRIYYISRNKIYMFKLHSFGLKRSFLNILNFMSDLKQIVKCLIHGELYLVDSIIKGMIDGAKSITGIKKEYH
ncbi:glycosyltransferase family 2 protein [Paenibacillus sp. WC2504]|uniref:glycosyltransferase family 2 protein n=1 Tax=Paenibacillus sp. WC2504 TaxID=3461403 RepID=UPI004045B249